MITSLERRVFAPAQALIRPPNQAAFAITSRPYLSYSQLALMRTCPRRFELRYVEAIPPAFISSSLLLGGALHSALEHHFRARLEGRATMAAELYEAYSAAWEHRLAGTPTPVRFNKGQDRQSMDDLARRLIDAFLRSSISRPRGTILGIEEELRTVLHPDLPDLLTRLDLLIWTPRSLQVVDFKTSRCRWNMRKTIESADQLVLYGHTVAAMARSLSVGVKLNFVVLTKAKRPAVQAIEVPADADSIEAVKNNVGKLWAAIQAGRFEPDPSPMNCCTCPYSTRCTVA